MTANHKNPNPTNPKQEDENMKNFKRGDVVRDIYTNKIYTVKKDGYWQFYAGGNTSDFTIELEPTEDQKTPWNKASNLELVITKGE